MKVVSFAVLIFLAIIGISHIVFELSYRFFKIKDDNSLILIRPKKDRKIDIEFSIRSAILKMKKFFRNGVCDIYILKDSLDDNSLKELYYITKDYKYLQLVTKDEFIKKAELE